jgi:hypothetical protein
MYATHSPRSTAASTTCRSSVSFPVAPTTSVSRPRGRPPDASARSSASTPVGIPGVCGSGAGNNARNDSTRNADGERAAMAELTSKPRLQSSGLDPKKDRKCATGKVHRQRLSADGLSTACPHSYIRTPTTIGSRPGARRSRAGALRSRHPRRRHHHGRTERHDARRPS